ncbi:MAG TPA: hypothetical protein VHX42_02045 [Candidatus Babeliales bacterium]|jgi:hypothetical protein|nr:hypothetical protein [Candidatus Babeliales bacterium]
MIALKKEYVMLASSCVIFVVVGSEHNTSNMQCKSAADEYRESFNNSEVVDTLLAHLAVKYCKDPAHRTIGSDTQHGRRYYFPFLKDSSNQKTKERWFGRGSSGPGEGRAKL